MYNPFTSQQGSQSNHPIHIQTNSDSKSQRLSQAPVGHQHSQSQQLFMNPESRRDFESGLQEIKRKYEADALEVKKQYEQGFEKHQKMNNAIGELQHNLENETKKSTLLEEKNRNIVRDLDHERRLRIDADHDVNKLKEDNQRKEQAINDYELRQAKLSQELEGQLTDNSNLRTEVNRLAQFYQQKIREVEEKYMGQVNDLTNQNDVHRSKIENITLDFSNQIRQMSFDYEQKIRGYEDTLREKERVIAELNAEIRSHQEQNSKIKMEYEEEIRRQCGYARDEEKSKWQIVIKDLENQLRTVSEDLDSQKRRNQDVVRETQAKDRQLNDFKNDFDNDMNRARNDANELKRQAETHLSTIQRMTSENDTKESSIIRLRDEIQNYRREMERVKVLNQQDRSRLINEHKNEIKYWEDNDHVAKNKILDLERRYRDLEDEIRSLKSDHQRVKDNLQNGINKSLSSTFTNYDNRTSMNKNFL